MGPIAPFGPTAGCGIHIVSEVSVPFEIDRSVDEQIFHGLQLSEFNDLVNVPGGHGMQVWSDTGVPFISMRNQHCKLDFVGMF